MNENQKILKEYIKKLFVEYGDALGPFDMADPSDFSKAFIKPFTDVGKTTKKVFSQFGVKAKSLLKTLTGGITSILIPGVSKDYSSIFEQEKRDMQEIRQKYWNINQHTQNVLKNDASLLGFMLSPVTFISSVLVLKSPQKALEIVKGIAPNNPYVKKKYGSISNFIQGIKRVSSKYEKMLKSENIQLNEDAFEDRVKQDIVDFITDEETQRILNDSSVIKSMKRDAEELVNRTINQIKQKVDEAINFEDFEDLKKEFGVAQDLIPSQYEDLPEKELDTVKKMVVSEAKESIVETYLKLVNANINEMKNLKFDKNNIKLLQKYEDLKKYIESKLK